MSFSIFSYFEDQPSASRQPVAMVSRRKILSRSRDDLNLDCDSFRPGENKEEEDVWYAKEKLYKVRTWYSKTKGSHFLNVSHLGSSENCTLETDFTTKSIVKRRTRILKCLILKRRKRTDVGDQDRTL